MKPFGLVPGLILLAAPLAGQPDMQNLLTNSPFGQARSAGAQETPGAAWEFRGVAQEAGAVWYSLYDTTAKRSVWVREGETPPGLAIRSFNADTLTLSLDYQGKSLVLPIKRAPIVAQPPMPMPMPQGGPTGGPVPAMGNAVPGVNPANSPADAQRIQQVTEEIRRRRALRQQAVQQGPQPQPTGNP